MKQNELLLTVDFEEPYHGLRSCEQQDYSNYSPMLPECTRELLDLLDTYDARATFFVLGRVAERRPDLIAEIQKAGHEVASHSYDHKLLYEMDGDEFRDQMRRSYRTIADVTGEPVRGFRAPYFSAPGERTSLFFETLMDVGYRYDSSFVRTLNPLYGFRGELPRGPAHGDFLEIPMSHSRFLGFPYPVSGGVYFRTIPYAMTKRDLENRMDDRDQLAMVYIHPWELEAGGDSLWNQSTLVEKVTHFVGRRGFKSRFTRLLDDFETSPIEQYGCGMNDRC